MENLTKVFSYGGSTVTFRKHGGSTYVNATEMAKNFGKQPVHWLNQNGTTEFIAELSKLRNRSLADLVMVTKGGNASGTWMHEDVAIEFSRWLSPAFAIWCNDRIKELLTIGMTATQPTIDQMIEDPDILIRLATQLKEERAAKEAALETSKLQAKSISIMGPKAESYDKIYNSTSLITATLIAKDLGFRSVEAFNRRLVALKIQFRRGGTYVLTSNYSALGYTQLKTYPFYDSKGELKSSQTMHWTEKGRKFLIDLKEAGKL